MKFFLSNEQSASERFWTLLGIILFLSLSMKIYRLEVPSTFVFDEVYHAYTAQLYLKNSPKSYSLEQTNTKEAVEWTHPPLAKLFIALGMIGFGDNSFGWRLSSTIFGTLAALMAALLAWQLFGSAPVSYLTAFFMSIEGLVFTQSRLAMIDVHLLFFFLMSLYFYVRWKKNRQQLKFLFFSSVGFGLALSCKWSAIFTLFILGVDQLIVIFKERRTSQIKEILWMILFFIPVPVAIYIASYGHFFWMGHDWAYFVRVHENMWWYHTHLDATHDYSSKPWQWIFNWRPVSMHAEYTDNPKTMANIYNLGNSVILYFGFATVIWQLLRLIRGKMEWAFGFCLLCYFLVWLPWIFSPRIMFFYHYTPAIPALCILMSKQLEVIWQKGFRNTAYFVVALASVWFLIFYPKNTAVALPEDFVQKYYFIIPSWR